MSQLFKEARKFAIAHEMASLKQCTYIVVFSGHSCVHCSPHWAFVPLGPFWWKLNHCLIRVYNPCKLLIVLL